MLKNSFARAVALLAAALVLAVVSNGFASRQRRLMLPGYYPNALRVPPPERPAPPPALAPQATGTAPVVTTAAPVVTATQAPAVIPTATTTGRHRLPFGSR